MAANGATVDVPDVVDKALVHIAAKQGFKKPRFDVRSGSNNRDGFMSTLYRCVIHDEDSAGPADLKIMVKISREGMERMMTHLFGVEGLTYDTLIPALEEIAGLQEPLPWSKCYYSSVKGAHPLCLALGDFAPEGFRMATRGSSLDENHVRLALEHLGKLHGASMALARLRPDFFKSINDNLPNLTRKPEFYEMMKPIVAGVPQLPDLVKHRFPEGSQVQTVLRKLCTTFADHFYKIMWPMTPKDGRGCALIHGDCHINNMAFKYDKDGAVQACRLYDFQGTSWKPVAQDMMILLFCNTDKAMRDKHWDSLLRGYLDVVHATLRAAGCSDPEDMLSWDMLQEQLRRCAAPMLCVQPVFQSLMSADDSMVDEVRNSFQEAEVHAGTGDSPAYSTSLVKQTPKIIGNYVGLIENVLAWGWLPSAEDIDRWVTED